MLRNLLLATSRLLIITIVCQLMIYPIAKDYQTLQHLGFFKEARAADATNSQYPKLSQEEIDEYYAEENDLNWKERDHRYCEKEPEACENCDYAGLYNQCEEMPETTKAESNEKGKCFRKYQDQRASCLQARETNYLDARNVVYENEKDELGVYTLYLANNLLIMSAFICPTSLLSSSGFIAWVAALTWTIGEIVTNKKLDKALKELRCDLLELQARGNVTDITKGIKVEKSNDCKKVKVTNTVDVNKIKSWDESGDVKAQYQKSLIPKKENATRDKLSNTDKYGLNKDGPKVMESEEFYGKHGDKVAKARLKRFKKTNQHMIFYKKYRDGLKNIFNILKEKKAIWHAVFALYFTMMSVGLVETVWFVICLAIGVIIFILFILTALVILLATFTLMWYIALIEAGAAVISLYPFLVIGGVDPLFCAPSGLATFLVLTGLTVSYCTAVGIKHEIDGDILKSAENGKVSYQRAYGEGDQTQSYDYSTNSGQYQYNATNDGERETVNASDDIVAVDASGDPITRYQIEKVQEEAVANDEHDQRETDGDKMNAAFLKAFTQLGGHGDLGACALFGCMAGITPITLFGLNNPPGRFLNGLFMGTLGAVMHDKFLKKKIENLEERIDYMDNLMLKLSQVTAPKKGETAGQSLLGSDGNSSTGIRGVDGRPVPSAASTDQNQSSFSSASSGSVTTDANNKPVCTCNGIIVDCQKVNSTCSERKGISSVGGTDPQTGKTTTLLSSRSPELSGIDKHMSENISNIGSGKIDTAKLNSEAANRMAMAGKLRKEAMKQLAKNQGMSEKEMRRKLTKGIVEVAKQQKQALVNALGPIKKAGKLGAVDVGPMADLFNMFESTSSSYSQKKQGRGSSRPGIASSKKEEKKRKGGLSSLLGARKRSYGGYSSGSSGHQSDLSTAEKTGALKDYLSKKKDQTIHKDDVGLFKRITNAYYRALKFLSE